MKTKKHFNPISLRTIIHLVDTYETQMAIWLLKAWYTFYSWIRPDDFRLSNAKRICRKFGYRLKKTTKPQFERN